MHVSYVKYFICGKVGFHGGQIVVLLCLLQLADDRAAAVLEMVWNRVKELMRKSSFWPVYDAFLELTFQNSLMQCTPELETSKFLIKVFRFALFINMLNRLSTKSTQ